MEAETRAPRTSSKGISINLNHTADIGINITKSDFYILIENLTVYNGTNDGIYLVNDSHVTIREVGLFQIDVGIELDNCTNIAVSEGILQNTGAMGFYIHDGTSNVTIANIAISDTSRYGIHIADSVGVALSWISLESIGYDGIYIDSCANTTASNWSLDNVGNDALDIYRLETERR